MKVILKQQEDNNDIVNIVFYNNTPKIQFLDRNYIGAEGCSASAYENMKDFFVPTFSDTDITEEYLVSVSPGQTFTSKFNVRKSYDTSNVKDLYIIYSHHHPTDGLGSEVRLLQSKMLHITL